MTPPIYLSPYFRFPPRTTIIKSSFFPSQKIHPSILSSYTTNMAKNNNNNYLNPAKVICLSCCLSVKLSKRKLKSSIPRTLTSTNLPYVEIHHTYETQACIYIYISHKYPLPLPLPLPQPPLRSDRQQEIPSCHAIHDIGIEYVCVAVKNKKNKKRGAGGNGLYIYIYIYIWVGV